MYLCLDVGNTTIETALCEKDKIIKKFKVDTIASNPIENYSTALKKNVGLLGIEGIIISSVVPSLDYSLKKLLINQYGVEPIMVHNNLKHNINIMIEHPEELGSDLLISSVAAAKSCLGNTMVIDLGTANKLLILKNNDFLGGAITPGVRSSMNSLFSDAEKLSQVPIETPAKVIGNSTIKCIQSGIVYGTASMIEGMVKRMEQEIGKLNILLTGGNAEYVKDVLTFDFEYKPDLLIEGLMELYENNK